jgi:hypothetical protein
METSVPRGITVALLTLFFEARRVRAGRALRDLRLLRA